MRGQDAACLIHLPSFFFLFQQHNAYISFSSVVAPQADRKFAASLNSFGSFFKFKTVVERNCSTLNSTCSISSSLYLAGIFIPNTILKKTLKWFMCYLCDCDFLFLVCSFSELKFCLTRGNILF